MYFARESLILASGSPRRKQYLGEMGLQFKVVLADIDEQPLSDEAPDEFVTRMAREKALKVAEKFPESCVISGDTIVCLGSDILGKPTGKSDAVNLLMSLSGRMHEVKTGFCVALDAKKIFITKVVTTKVQFANYSSSLARAYVETGESLDKAGGYGIQGKGAFLVRSIIGSYSNVVGLPLPELLEILLLNNIIEVAKSSSY